MNVLQAVGNDDLLIDRQDDGLGIMVSVSEGLQIYIRLSESQKADYRSLEAR